MSWGWRFRNRSIEDALHIIRFEVQCKYLKVYNMANKIRRGIREHSNSLYGIREHGSTPYGTGEHDTFYSNGEHNTLYDIDEHNAPYETMNSNGTRFSGGTRGSGSNFHDPYASSLSTISEMLSELSCERIIESYFKKIIKTGITTPLTKPSRLLRTRTSKTKQNCYY